MHWLRSIGAVLLGMLAAMLFMMVSEILGWTLFPLPSEVDPHNMEAIRKLAEEGKIPQGGLLFVLAGWLLGSSVGSWVAARIANFGKLACGMIVGGIIFMFTVITLVSIPHPLMFSIGALLTIPLASYFGTTTAININTASK